MPSRGPYDGARNGAPALLLESGNDFPRENEGAVSEVRHLGERLYFGGIHRPASGRGGGRADCGTRSASRAASIF